jgi:CheY-like chemotaxis protein
MRKAGVAMSRVLVVEEEAPLRRIITLNLARRGYTVAEADSVASADGTLAVASNPSTPSCWT